MSVTKTDVTTAQKIGAQIARGQLGGMEPASAFGKLTVTGEVTKRIVWPNGDFTFPDQTAGETVSFVSTSDEDGAGTQTGINVLEVRYLDINLQPQTAEVTLNGITEVASQITGVRFIQSMGPVEVGSTLAAVGEIKAYRAGDAAAIFSVINPTEEIAKSSLRMVPKGKQLLVDTVLVSSISGTAAAKALLQFVGTEYGDRQYLDPFILIPQGEIGLQDNSVTLPLPVPRLFKEGTVVGLTVTVDKGATVSVEWFGWLEDAPAE